MESEGAIEPQATERVDYTKVSVTLARLHERGIRLPFEMPVPPHGRDELAQCGIEILFVAANDARIRLPRRQRRRNADGVQQGLRTPERENGFRVAILIFLRNSRSSPLPASCGAAPRSAGSAHRTAPTVRLRA